MNILINCSNLAAGGGIQVAHSFLNEVIRHGDHFFHVVLCSSAAEQIDSSRYPGNFRFHSYNLKPDTRSVFLGKNDILDRLCSDNAVNAVFTIFGPSFWKPKVPHLMGFARGKYIYKESPYFRTLGIKRRLKLLFKEIVDMHNFRRFSDALVTESWDVSARLQARFPHKKIFTVTNSYNQVFEKPLPADGEGLLPPFKGLTVLMISSYYYHKNFEIIPPTIKYLRQTFPAFPFRFALTIWETDHIRFDSETKKNVVFLGKVPIERCPELYRGSQIAFQPSFVECFSASYTEAMKMQVPLLASDLAFARSICGDAALYFDPTSAESAGNAIHKLATDFDLRRTLIDAGNRRLKVFDTPESRAEKYLAILSGLSRQE